MFFASVVNGLYRVFRIIKLLSHPFVLLLSIMLHCYIDFTLMMQKYESVKVLLVMF